MTNSFAATRLLARDALFTSVGMLVEPIRRTAIDGSVDPAILAMMRSRFRKDYDEFVKRVWDYGRVGSLEYHDECIRIRNVAWEMHNLFTVLSKSPIRGDALQRIDDVVVSIRAAIDAIPMSDPDTILPAATPFTTYLTLRAHCASARTRLELFDPYLDSTPFHRYLGDVESRVSIVIVTSSDCLAAQGGSKQATARRDRIVAVSELFAEERPTHYRLLAAGDLHDRYMRIDDQIFQLGGSVKDAARRAEYTIGKLDATAANHDALDQMIDRAEAWYGPGMSSHRRT